MMESPIQKSALGYLITPPPYKTWSFVNDEEKDAQNRQREPNFQVGA